MNTLICIGFGYCAEALASRLALVGGWRVIGTSRTAQGVEAIRSKGFEGLIFDRSTKSDELAHAIAIASHLLVSASPATNGDPVLNAYGRQLDGTAGPRWIGYLSTIGVYGDSAGAWVDETSEPKPSHDRAKRRLVIEQQWLDLAKRTDRCVQIFRIAGIYGPGRNALLDLREGNARRIVKPGQVFNRIHVADIAQALEAAMTRGGSNHVYNLTDDEPASGEAVLLYAAHLLGIDPPQAVDFTAAHLSPMAASFYADNRRVRNQRIKDELQVQLQYPNFRVGLKALLEDPPSVSEP